MHFVFRCQMEQSQRLIRPLLRNWMDLLRIPLGTTTIDNFQPYLLGAFEFRIHSILPFRVPSP